MRQIEASESHIDANRSPWLDGAPPQREPTPLRGDTTADVAIIGGGFTGVSTAYYLSARFPDKRIVLLEARTLANGASGRNGGMMLNWINGVDCKDPEGTQRVFAATHAGIDGIEAVIREHKLAVRYNRAGCLEVCTDAKRAEQAHARAEKLASWGIPVRYLQGAELDVIEGATRRMDDVLVVHTEIEFIPMYEDQPLFGDIDVALRRHGLLLHKMDGITGRAMKPLISNGNPYGPLSQWLYADAAIYVRSFMTFDQLSPEKLLKLALILHDVYGSFDLAALALEAHDAKTGQGLWTAYLTRLGASPST